MPQNSNISIKFEDISKIIEPIIRRVIREELTKIARQKPGIFYLEPEMPLYKDMQDLRRRKAKGKIDLYSHEEAWDE
ncbi:MAG: hypothetical protein JRE47_15255 [Deltaproteobacteria bacterium]|nr:hypothetical protein [Deltaproteobacteria bacterium]